MVTSGPAATNIVTPLVRRVHGLDPDGRHHRPGAVPRDRHRRVPGVRHGRHHPPVTKHNVLISDAQDIPRDRPRGVPHRHDRPPRPGADRHARRTSSIRRTPRRRWTGTGPRRVDLPGYNPTTTGDPADIRKAAELILQAERPVIYAGGGILKARAAEALRELAELCDIHVVTTLMARGAFPDDHPLCLGMPGMHGNYTAVTAMQKSDLLLALGSRFDDRVTGKVPSFAPDAKIIHVDIDPAELGKVRRPDVPSWATAAW